MFFFSTRRRHTRFTCDWSSDVCSSDLNEQDRHEQRARPANEAICREREQQRAGYRNVSLSCTRRSKPSGHEQQDRKSTRLNSSHMSISYAVFCLKKKKKSTYHKTNLYNSDVVNIIP